KECMADETVCYIHNHNNCCGSCLCLNGPYARPWEMLVGNCKCGPKE
uniref:Mu-segestritoxin-Sf1b n=1 Tax=Segestria florentina TaxID=31925 RepID=SFI2_SEGFL|nr:RecName: Full=Mu-segestritoxin-Sf1b; Short=Mu-SGTX-Sf1b; AltName: Full=F5.7; AltName: Full=Toxin SFI2 [Segestria florentina]